MICYPIEKYQYLLFKMGDPISPYIIWQDLYVSNIMGNFKIKL